MSGGLFATELGQPAAGAAGQTTTVEAPVPTTGATEEGLRPGIELVCVAGGWGGGYWEGRDFLFVVFLKLLFRKLNLMNWQGNESREDLTLQVRKQGLLGFPFNLCFYPGVSARCLLGSTSWIPAS